METTTIILIIIAVIIVCICIRNLHKLEMGNLVFIDGGVKKSKTTFSLYEARRRYKKSLFKWKVWKFFDNILNFKIKREMPLFYSNIPLAFPYVELTKDILMRKKRTRFGSIIYVDEASIVADSQLVHNKDANNRLLLFNKLIAHMTHGGTIFYNSQSNGDMHYSIKRCLSEYFYVKKCVKWIPFIVILTIEQKQMQEGTININAGNNNSNDIIKIISKKTWKYFDRYAFSGYTDNLPVEDKVIYNQKDLKVRKALSFRTEFEELINNELENSEKQKENKGVENGKKQN